MSTYIENIKKTEQLFPTLFSSLEERAWGGLFYDCDNPLSFDANHAFFATAPTEEQIVEVTDFYQRKNLTPRIKTIDLCSCDDAKQQTLMILSGENTIAKRQKLDIKIVKNYDSKISENILLGTQKNYVEKVLKKSLKNQNFLLFVGYLFDEPVSMLSAWKSPFGTVRIDNVQTGIFFRSCGFASDLMRFAVEHIKSEFCEVGSPPCVYLTTTNVSAKNIYTRAGFKTQNMGIKTEFLTK